MRKFSIIILVIFSIAIFYSAKNAPKKDSQKQPNFLFVMVDDQPYDAMGFMGRYPFLETPNMDRLAAEGANLQNFFVTQSICSPSRASFLTGTYPHIHGVNQNHQAVDPNWADYAPYSSHLQKVGYETAHIGKIHMAHRKGAAHIRPGFDYWFSFQGQGKFFNPPVNENGLEYVEHGYMTDILTEKTVKWLKEKRDPNKPFSLNLWHKAIHEPHFPAQRHVDLYKNEPLPKPPHNTHQETFEGKPEWLRRKTYGFRFEKGQKIPEALSEKEWPQRKWKFMNMLRCLQAVDESLGTVLATLEELGELDNTVIIFSSDNGYFMGDHTFIDKRLAYEASMRVPMLIRYPKLISPQTKVSEQCLNIDIAPTILELAGAEIPDYVQGESLVNLLKGEEKKDWRKSFLFEYYVDDEFQFAGPNQVAVRTDRYKFVDAFLKNDIDELYDLEADPGEMKNLINDSDFDAVEEDLRKESERLKKMYHYNPDRDWWMRKTTKRTKNHQ